MSAPGAITIVGGGLAGLTLGIALRQRGVPVVVHEAGRYPRHRVCGEFISGNGLEVLSELGLRARLEEAGGICARTAAFFSERGGSPLRDLPAPAFCLSRFRLDEWLANELVRLGGELRTDSRWTGSRSAEGVVCASGRRVQSMEAGWRWVGLKAHVRGVSLAADLEMHLLPNGYVGLCRLDGDVVNVCGLFRSRGPLPEMPHRRPEYLAGPACSPLQARLASAVWDQDSFCAVAGLGLRPVRAQVRDEFCVGDAVTMIPPVTGNGMSMALESAQLAALSLERYFRGQLSWAQSKEEFARTCDAAFSRRLLWARGLQATLTSRLGRVCLFQAVSQTGFLLNALFSRTR